MDGHLVMDLALIYGQWQTAQWLEFFLNPTVSSLQME